MSGKIISLESYRRKKRDREIERQSRRTSNRLKLLYRGMDKEIIKQYFVADEIDFGEEPWR